MNVKNQMDILRKKAESHPKFLEILKQLETVENALLEEDQKPFQLPYASPPKRPSNVWKRTF